MTDTVTPLPQDDGIASGWSVAGELAELAAAWVAALGELTDVARGREAVVETKAGGSYRYRYADLGDVLSQARAVLARHSLAVFQVAQVVELDIAVTTTVMHASGAHFTFAPFRLPAGNTVQATGSSITYARRYGLMSILGLATDDDDGASAGTRPAGPDTVVETFNALTALSSGAQAELRRLADEHDRKLSQAALAADPAWLTVVQAVIERDRRTAPAEPHDAPPSNTTPVRATRAQLATIDSLERRAELGLARPDVQRAVLDRDVDDLTQLTRHEADRWIGALQGIVDGSRAVRYEPDGSLTLISGTHTTTGISSLTESGPS